MKGIMLITMLSRLSLKKTLALSIFICLGFVLYTEFEVLFNNTFVIQARREKKEVHWGNKDNEHYENMVSSLHYIMNIKMLLYLP